jgi:thioredoxin reductase (NADPH)
LNQPTVLSPEALAARRAQMFPSLTPAQVERVRACGVEEHVAAGAVLFDQGQEDVPFYVIVEGLLEIVHPQGADEHMITVHEPFEFTGEVNMLTERRVLVRARAKGPLRVLRVENARLRQLLQTDSDLSDVVMRAFILRRVGLVSSGYGDAVVVGSRDSAATLRVQEFLVRNGHPFKCISVEREPDIQTFLDGLHVALSDIPILICRGERVLKNPTDAEIADCLGFNPKLDPGVVHDLVICGAGPAGLAAAVYGASEGLNVLVVEAGSPGGQAASSSKIENYLGFPTGVSGQALAARALTQAEKFGARLTVARGATRLHCDETPTRIELANGDSVHARAVVIATGAEYRKLELEGLARFEGVGIYYAATQVEAQRCDDCDVVVIGGANSAGQAATFLARMTRHVHMLIRGPDLASSMSRYLIRRIEETPNITVRRRTRIVGLAGGDHLEQVTWRDDTTGEETTHPIRHVFSMAGACPNTDWLKGCVVLDERGFVKTGNDLDARTLQECGWSLSRPPHLFETSQPRIFAVGDVRSTSVKRVASAVGEGSVCVQLVHRAIAE